MNGGPDSYFRVPGSYSLDELDQDGFTFETWINMENLPDNQVSDAFYAIGIEQVPNDSFFNDIETLSSNSDW